MKTNYRLSGSLFTISAVCFGVGLWGHFGPDTYWAAFPSILALLIAIAIEIAND